VIPGDIVIVLGKRDTKVRDKNKEELAIGTLVGFVCDDQAYVLLPDGEIWIGLKREIQVYEKEDSEKEDIEEPEEKGPEEENEVDL